ncbi:MAG: protein ImuB [Candidatus Azotimanducaceae bacterium]|jgi:protein ImuB
MNTLWMCLYFKNLPLEVFSRIDAEKNQHAIVILQKQRIFHMNELAQATGIQLGNNMDTAYSLSDQLLSFERNEDKEKSTLAYLAQWAYQFTPTVSIKLPNCLLLDISGCLKLFKGLDNLIGKVTTSLNHLGFQALLSINISPLSALLMAKAQSTVLINKDKQKLEQSIGTIPIQYLQADQKIITALKQMGIANLQDLIRLPPSGLIRRFGTDFSDYLQRLIGTKADPQKTINPSTKFSSTINFLFDVKNLNSLVFPIKRLLKELGDFLSARQLCINHFTWHLSHRNVSKNANASTDSRKMSISLASPINEYKAFYALTQLKLDQIKNIKEVDSITLAVNHFHPVVAYTKTLFQDNTFPTNKYSPNNISDKNCQLFNILNVKLGPEQCFGLSQSNDHRPEKAWKPLVIGNQKPAENKELTKGKDINWRPESLPRPNFLLTTPKVLKVLDEGFHLDMRSLDIKSFDIKKHQMKSLKVIGFGAGELSGKLTLLRGPERIDYGWWDQAIDKPLTRDYYIARQEDGSLYWIFRLIALERWYLHGIFS